MQEISGDILLKAGEGDITAFEFIYNTISIYVFNIALRIAQNNEDAQEITQDVFLKIYKNLKKFRFKSSFKTWVYRITVNTAINRYRKSLKERRRNTSLDEEWVERKDYDLDKSRILDKEFISSLLEKLNPEQRTCIILREIEGLSYKEIADVLKVNINTVRSRLRRARENLLLQYKKR